MTIKEGDRTVNDVKIITHGGTAEIYVDGIPMHDKCSAFSVEHSVGGYCKLKLVLHCKNIEIEGDAETAFAYQTETEDGTTF